MKQVFRSRMALVLGWIWMVFAAANAVDLIVRYSGPSSLTAAAVLGVMTALVFITCLRPAIILTEDGLLVRNPLRNTRVPWEAVDEVTVSHSIKITSGDGSVRCWAPQASARERAAAVRRGNPARTGSRTEPARSKGEQAAAEALAGKTHADWVADQITERAESAKRAATPAAGQPGAGADGGTGGKAAEPAGAADAQAVESGGPAATAGAMKVSWAPSALAALLAAAVLVVAAILA
ncbi:PH domain-containing protein [Streptosporangium sp. NBC_01639]|uniref:PH domain-containing protein n=1 Tax=Streptosporangium sp. NBC_01639 TaxID=2975948 RepID=UPI003869F29F|nr:PH domain-containing protein [Streptosporangium sp. NBC_01639]